MDSLNCSAQVAILTPGASPEEAAIVLAALERFRRGMTPRSPVPAPRQDAWQRAALHEGVSREWPVLGGWA